MSNVTDQLADYYKKLFTLGTLHKNLVFFLLLNTSILLYVYLVVNIFSISILHKPSFLYIMCFIPAYSLAIDYLIMRNNNRDKQLYSLRRLLAINNILCIFLLLGLIIFTPLLIFNKGYVPILHFIIIVLIGYKLIIFFSTSQSKLQYISTNLILMYVIFIVGLFIMNNYFLPPMNNYELYLTIFLVGSGVALSLGYILYIDRISRKITGVSVYSYLKGFIDSWVMNDPSTIENLISQNAITVKSETDYIVFPDIPSFPLLVLVPYFHFGPFKNVGSSDFPALASKYFFNKNGMAVMIFHSPSIHSLDIPNKEEIHKIIRYIDDFSSPIIANSMSNILTLKSQLSTVHLVKIDGFALIFLEAEEMEDVPPKVIKVIRLEAKKLGYKHVIVVDSHNSLTKIRYRLSDELVDDMIKLTKKALKEGLTLDTYPFKAGFAKINLPSITISSGLGNSGVSILVWETLTSRNIVINFDSNNLSPHLRSALINMAREEFKANIIVTTNDTHEVSAVPLNIRGYNILGERREDIRIILHYLRTGIIKCLERMKESDILVYHKEFNISVIGMDALEKLNKVLSTSYSAAKKILYRIVIPLLILDILVTYAILLII